MDEQELRSQAALRELNTVNQMLLQRCVNLAGDLALSAQQVRTLTAQVEKQAAGSSKAAT